MNDELKEAENINFPDEEQFGQFMSQYRQLMLLYESAVQNETVSEEENGLTVLEEGLVPDELVSEPIPSESGPSESGDTVVSGDTSPSEILNP